MIICDRHGHWKRAPGRLQWYSDELPGWCVTATFQPDRRGVYYRQFMALYRGTTVGEVANGSTQEQVMDEIVSLLGCCYHSPNIYRSLTIKMCIGVDLS